MSKRRESREAAAQFLYQFDIQGGDPNELLAHFWKLREGPGKAPATAKVRAFAEELIAGVLAHRVDIDQRITDCLQNYDFHRVATVDRNIMRVAVFEMLHSLGVPPIVALNEAIEVAKRFGAEESARFTNGILDRICKSLTRPAREALDPRDKA